jgi:hypothetical protein
VRLPGLPAERARAGDRVMIDILLDVLLGVMIAIAIVVVRSTGRG